MNTALARSPVQTPAPADAFSWLPEVLAQIAAVAGIDAALAIARVKGGARCTFPPKVREDHWLAELVGRDTANAICKELATGIGVELLIPRGEHATRKRRFYDLRAEGMSVEGAARACGATVRACRVWEKNKSLKAEARMRVGAAERARARREASPQIDLVDLLDQRKSA